MSSSACENDRARSSPSRACRSEASWPPPPVISARTPLEDGLEALEPRLELAQQLEPADVVTARIGQLGAVEPLDPREQVGHRLQHGVTRDEAERRRHLRVRALVVAR